MCRLVLETAHANMETTFHASVTWAQHSITCNTSLKICGAPTSTHTSDIKWRPPRCLCGTVWRQTSLFWTFYISITEECWLSVRRSCCRCFLRSVQIVHDTKWKKQAEWCWSNRRYLNCQIQYSRIRYNTRVQYVLGYVAGENKI